MGCEGNLDYVLKFSKQIMGLRELVAKSTCSVDVSVFKLIVAFHFTDPVFAFLVVLVVVRNMKSKVSPRVEERERESSDSNTSNSSSSSSNGTSSLSLPSLGVIFPKSNASAAALTSFLYLASGGSGIMEQ